MTGPEHYAKAEELAEMAADQPSANWEAAESLIRRAHVHATLALTAATIQAQMGDLSGTWGRTINPGRYSQPPFYTTTPEKP